MHFLLLCILSSTSIFVVFKSIDRFQVPSFPVIVINYMLATLLGFFFNAEWRGIPEVLNKDWLPVSMAIGILFIVMFFLVAHSSRKAGISVTTVASKMSVIFPIAFSMVIDTEDQFTLLKALAILTALAGVTLTVFNPEKVKSKRGAIFIPLVLFAGMGLVDSLVKFAQHNFVRDHDAALFSAILFLNAFITGGIILLFSPQKLKAFRSFTVWGWGILLGSVNFGSIYFLVRTLNFNSSSGFSLDSSAVFGINNSGIVVLSVLIGFVVFTERLRPLNWVGIALSVFALLLFGMGL